MTKRIILSFILVVIFSGLYKTYAQSDYILMISKYEVDGVEFVLGDENYNYGSVLPGSEVKFYGSTFKINGFDTEPVPNVIIGVTDGLLLFSTEIESDINGEFIYETSVTSYGINEHREILFTNNSNDTFWDLGFVINVVSFDEIIDQFYLDNKREELNVDYASEILELSSKKSEGEFYWSLQHNAGSGFNDIRTVNDVDRNNYASILRMHNFRATDPFSGRPEIRQKAYEIENVILEENVDQILGELSDQVGPARLIVYVGGSASCVATKFGNVVVGPKSCALVAKMATQDYIKLAGAELLETAGASQEVQDGYKKGVSYVGLVTDITGAVTNGEYVGLALAGAESLERGILESRLESSLEITSGLYNSYLGSQSFPISDVTYKQINGNYVFNFAYKNKKYKYYIGYEESLLSSDFSVNVNSGEASLTVQFTDQSEPSTKINSWQWDFNNDGIVDSEIKNPSYTYDVPGNYSVSLTVSDGINSITKTKENYITVTEEPIVNPDLTMYFDEGPYIKDEAISVRVKTEPATESLKFDFTVTPNNGSIQVFNSGITNNFGIANAEFVPSSGGEFIVEANNNTLGKVSKSVTVANTIPPTFSPSFMTGNETQSEYNLYFKYQGFSWSNDPFTIRTDNGSFKSSGTQEYSGTMSRQTSLSTNLVVNESKNTTIWLEHDGNVYQYSFIPQLISNEEIPSFTSFSYSRLNDFDWSPIDSTILIVSDRNVIKVNSKTWNAENNVRIASNEVEAISTNKSGSKFVYADDDKLHLADPIALNPLGVSSSTFSFTDYTVLDWSYDDSKVVGVDWETHVILNASNLSTSRNNTNINVYEVDASFRNNSSHYAVSIDNLDDRDVAIYNTNGTFVRSILASVDREGRGVSYSPDGKYLATSSQNGPIKIFDATNNYIEVATISDDYNRLVKLRWNPNPQQNILAVSITDNSNNSRVYFYDVDNNSRLFMSEIMSPIDIRDNMKWSKNGEMLGVTSNNQLRIFSPFDQTPPTITTSLPTTTQSESLEITGSVIDASGYVSLEMLVNNELVETLEIKDDPDFKATLNLEVGTNEIRIIGKDRFLNSSEKSFNVERVMTHLVSGTVLLDENPLDSVLVSLLGSKEKTILTDSNGDFSFDVIANDTIAIGFSKVGYEFDPEFVNINDITADSNFAIIASKVIIALGMPDLISPNIGDSVKVDVPIAFSWRSVINATEYEIQFDEEPIISTGADTSFTLVTDSAGEKTWKARAKNAELSGEWSESRTFTVIHDTVLTNLPPIVSILNGPSNSSVIDFNSPSFVWSGKDPDGSIAEYNVVLEGPTTESFSTTDTLYSFENLINGDYVFRVQAIDNEADTSEWASRSFSVMIPQKPIKVDFSKIYTALVGDTLVIPINIGDLQGYQIESFEFEIGFDKESIEVLSVDKGDALNSSFTIESNAFDGSLFVSAASTEVITDSGAIAYVTVHLIAGGQTELKWSSFYFNEGNPVADTKNGIIKIVEYICGDVSGDGLISAIDASFVLRHSVKLSPQFPLTGNDSTAADVTGNGWISAYDASQILKYNVGIPSIMNCSPPMAKQIPLAVSIDWSFSEISEEQVLFSIPIYTKDVQGDLSSADIKLPMSEGLEFKGISYTPENWQIITNQNQNTVFISMFGLNGISGDLLGELQFEITDKTKSQSLEGQVIVNENSPVNLERLIVYELPKDFTLSQNYPNPFNPTTKISYSIPEATEVKLEVFNLLGQKVATLADGNQNPGRYTVEWDASTVSSGIYVYRLSSNSKVLTNKMMLIK